MRFTTLLVAFSASCTLVFGLGDSIEGYSVSVPAWEVEITPGGETVLLNGTIEEVREQLLQLNPNWDNEYLKDLPEENQDALSNLDKRSDFYKAKFNCGLWSKALNTPIADGIKYLRGVNGRPCSGPGPSSCARVSCSYGSGIWWCNDDKKGKLLESFGSIADGAGYVLGKCGNNAARMVSGQVFHRTNWNVIVRKANC